MFARIVVGLVIGVVAGLVLSAKLSLEAKTLQIALWFVGVVAIGFIAASFMFGAVFGVMAVGEIAVGYFVFAAMSQSVTNKK